MSAPAEPTHVYVLGFSDGVIKVGRTSNPVNRRRQHSDDARVRRATITHEWELEHENAKDVERLLISVARQELEPIVGEYFSGNFRRFMKRVVRKFKRHGILAADRLTFDEVLEQYGVSREDLHAAREDKSLTQHPQILMPQNVIGRNLFLCSEVDRWFSRYGIAERLRERAEAFQWRQDNKGGIIEASKRRQLMRVIEAGEAAS